MMMSEHTWSWASEPAGCTVHPRALSLLPWGGTAVLTPPSDVICGSSPESWLSGNGCCITLCRYPMPPLSGHWRMTKPSSDSTVFWQIFLFSACAPSSFTPGVTSCSRKFLQFQREVETLESSFQRHFCFQWDGTYTHYTVTTHDIGLQYQLSC